jgi:glycosyltransferase involved in cell wall biosynthesis
MSNKYPLVTIGIPTYNRAGISLTSTLDSALNQSYPNLEIIISDNCSTDNTSQTIRGYNDERIRYIRQAKNIGSNNNYNACLNAAKGDYFLLLHDDDLIDHDLIKTCIEAANYSKKYGLIRTGTRMVDSDVKTIKEPPNIVENDTPEALFDAWLSGKVSFYFCSTLFNTYGLREIGGLKSNNNLFEDGFAIIKLSEHYPILNIVDVKASFRHHDEQRTHAALSVNWCEDFRQALDIMYLQDPVGRKQLYEKGMNRFAKVSIHFARKYQNPFVRAKSMLLVGKHFPYRYWPAGSWKTAILGRISTIIFHAKKPSLET